MNIELTEHQKRNKEIHEAKSKENFEYIEGERAKKLEVTEVQKVIFPAGDCRVTKLVNDEVVTGFLHEDGVFTHAQPVKNDYDVSTDNKVAVKITTQGINGRDVDKIIYVEDTREKPKEVSDRVFSVYKKVWGSSSKYYRVGSISYNEDVKLEMPKHRKPEIDEYDGSYRGHPETVEKFHSVWYRDTNPTDDRKNMKVSFVPSNDVYEIVNSNKNESIGYVSFEGNVIYWNQYRY